MSGPESEPIPTSLPIIGALFAGRYRLEENVASGPYSALFRAEDTRLKRPVAIKVLRVGQMDEDGEARFRREGQSAARLSHPGIVHVYDFDLEGSLPYLVLEWVPGRDLWALLDGGEAALDVADAVTIALNVLDALDHMQAQAIVHRDLKPENIMVVGDDYRVKITDFGLAYAFGGDRITREGVVAGSAFYLSPEVAEGQPADARSDLYALGVILYELLTGRLPFYSENPLAVISQHLNQEPHPPSSHNPLVGPELEGIVLKLLAKRPEERFQTAREVSDVLVALAGGKTPSRPQRSVSGEPEGPAQATARWLLLSYKVPSEPSASRVYVWRKLKRLGAVLLHDAVWVLPANDRMREQLQWLAVEITEMDGDAIFWEAPAPVYGDDEGLVRQFVAQADAAYGEILEALSGESPDLAALSRKYQQVKLRDHFGSSLEGRVREALLAAREEMTA